MKTGAEYQAEFRRRNPWYVSWQMARQRCANPKTKSYAAYGGRGIKCLVSREEVAELWERDAAHRMADPTLDRIDNNGNYELTNCRFVERSVNSQKASGYAGIAMAYGLTSKAKRKMTPERRAKLDAMKASKCSY